MVCIMIIKVTWECLSPQGAPVIPANGGAAVWLQQHHMGTISPYGHYTYSLEQYTCNRHAGPSEAGMVTMVTPREILALSGLQCHVVHNREYTVMDTQRLPKSPTRSREHTGVFGNTKDLSITHRECREPM